MLDNDTTIIVSCGTPQNASEVGEIYLDDGKYVLHRPMSPPPAPQRLKIRYMLEFCG